MPNAEPRPIPLLWSTSRLSSGCTPSRIIRRCPRAARWFRCRPVLLTRCPDYSRDETRDGVLPRRAVKSRSTRSNLIAGTIKPIRRYPPTRLVAGSLSIGHRARTGFDCWRAARKSARNLLSPIPFGSLSSCQICRYSPEKQPVDISRVFACASHTPAQSIGGSASGRGGHRLDCTLSHGTCR